MLVHKSINSAKKNKTVRLSKMFFVFLYQPHSSGAATFKEFSLYVCVNVSFNTNQLVLFRLFHNPSFKNETFSYQNRHLLFKENSGFMQSFSPITDTHDF